MVLEANYNYPIRALQTMAQGGHEVLAVTAQDTTSYASFQKAVIAFANHLKVRGVGPGSIVALTGFDAPTYMALVLAVGLNGAAFIHGNRTSLRSVRVTHLLHGSSQKLSGYKNTFEVDLTWLNMPNGIENAAKLTFSGYSSPDTIAAYFQSSGSTGTPKIIPYTAQNLALYLAQRDEQFPEATRIALLFPTPYFASVGWFLTMLLRQGCVIVRCSWDGIVKENPDIVVGSLLQLRDVIETADRTSQKRLPMAYTGGVGLPLKTRKNLLKYFEKIKLSYASVEMGVVAIQSIDADNIEDLSIGEIFPRVKLKIVDENDVPLSSGEIGHVKVLTTRMGGGNSEFTKDTSNGAKDEWIYPGDMGYRDDEGKIFITGRADDRLNIGGIKLNAVNVDLRMIEVEGVKECGTFTWTNPEKDLEDFALAVVLDEGEKQEDVLKCIEAVIERQLDSSQFIKKIFVVDNLPRTETGKIQRRKIPEVISNCEA